MIIPKSLLVPALLVAVLPVCAGQSSHQTDSSLRQTHNTRSDSTELGWHGWGVRVGVASDVDQVLGGAQFNLGELARNLRVQPDVELGAGDDMITLYGTLPVYYRFRTSGSLTPYAGGGLALGYVDADLPASSNGDETSVEFGARATGGLEWPRQEGQAFFVELSLGFGDVHDARVIAAWQF